MKMKIVSLLHAGARHQDSSGVPRDCRVWYGAGADCSANETAAAHGSGQFYAPNHESLIKDPAEARHKES